MNMAIPNTDPSLDGHPCRDGVRIVEPKWKPGRRHIVPFFASVLALIWLVVSCYFAQVDLLRLVTGLPRLGVWIAKSWPPNINDLGWVAHRTMETVAIATVATAVATVLSFPLSILAARNMVENALVTFSVRFLLNCLRGIDTIILALLFIVAVGLGPFAGVLGMILHTIGVMAKLNSEQIETLHRGPIDAARITGANGVKVVSFAVLPATIPNLVSTSLYLWEGNVRASTVLGIVGAGGIGMEIKSALELLDFQRLLTLTIAVLIMVTSIDALSAWLRKRLV